MKKNNTDVGKKWLKCIGLPVVLLAIWILLFYIYRSVVIPAAGTAVTQTCIDTTGEYGHRFEVSEGKMELIQSFFVTSPELSGLGLAVQSKDGSVVESVKAHVLLVDGMTKEPIFDDDVVVENVTGATHLNIIFDKKIEDSQDMYMEMWVTFSEECSNRIWVQGTADPRYEYLECQLNRESIPQAIGLEQYVVFGHFILNLYKIFVAVISVFVAVFYWLAVIKRSKLEHLYLIAVLVLGLLFSFIMIPFSVPDESMHASSIYRITNDLMGIEETQNPDTIYKRHDDAAIYLNNDANLNQYYVVYSNLFKMAENEELYETGYRDTGVTGFMYAPAVLGIVIGRLVGMGPVMMYMFARVLMLVFYALMTTWAVKKLPFGKLAMCIIGILPMSLQQAASLSYDCVVHSITLLFTAFCFALAYSGGKIKKKDVIITALLGFLLIFAKSGAYLPLVALLALIPAWKVGSVRKKWLSISVFVVILAAVFLFNSVGLIGRAGGGEIVSDGSIQYYSISYFLQNPKAILSVGMATLVNQGSYYISTMIGQRLGFLNIILDDSIVFVFLLLLGVSLLKQEDEPMYLTVKDKSFMGLSIVCSVAMVLASMLFFITPLGSGIILGVQGRYFIPILWITLMMFRNRAIVWKKDRSHLIILVAVLMNVLVFANIIREIFVL